MTEEQKQMTLGQVADMKAELENNVKNLLSEFIEKTGALNASIDASVENYANLDSNNSVVYSKNECAHLRYSFSW